jgi:hypothetical protein
VSLVDREVLDLSVAEIALADGMDAAVSAAPAQELPRRSGGPGQAR